MHLQFINQLTYMYIVFSLSIYALLLNGKANLIAMDAVHACFLKL